MLGPMRRRGLLVLATVVLAVGVAACGGGEDGGGESQRTIRVGYGFELDAGGVGDRIAFDVMEEETGMQATFSVLGSPRNTIVALQRGDIDIGKPGFDSTLQAIQQGARLKIVLPTAMVSESVLVAKGATSVAQLKGKRIGVHASPDESEVVAKALLKKAGLEESDVDIVALPESTNRAAALVSGRLDAAVLENVDYFRIRGEEPDLHLLGTAKDLIPFPVSRVNVVSQEFIDDEPELLQDMTDGLLDGFERLYTEEGKEEWLAKAKATALEGESDEVIEQIYDFYRDIEIWPHRSEVPTKQQYDQGMRFRLDNGLLEGPLPSWEQAFDLSFWEKASED